MSFELKHTTSWQQEFPHKTAISGLLVPGCSDNRQVCEQQWLGVIFLLLWGGVASPRRAHLLPALLCSFWVSSLMCPYKCNTILFHSLAFQTGHKLNCLLIIFSSQAKSLNGASLLMYLNTVIHDQHSAEGRAIAVGRWTQGQQPRYWGESDYMHCTCYPSWSWEST